MSRHLTVDLFIEDRAHEELLKPLVKRIAREEHVDVVVRVRSARGGHARAVQEFVLYQRVVADGSLGQSSPDIVVVGVDGNCTTYAKKRAEVQAAKSSEFNAGLIVASPDPHVERWYLVDPVSFAEVVGYPPVVGKNKCERDHYKKLLADAVTEGGHPPTLGGIEFAAELVDAMDLYRAGKGDHSFRAFVEDLRTELRSQRDALPHFS